MFGPCSLCESTLGFCAIRISIYTNYPDGILESLVARSLGQHFGIGQGSHRIPLYFSLYPGCEPICRGLDFPSFSSSPYREFACLDLSLTKNYDVWDPAEFSLSYSTLKRVITVVQIHS